MLIDNSGVKKGVMPIEDALKAAQDVDMDLVQVSNNDAKPVVAKILDYGKYIFDKKKSQSASKVKVRKNTLKEIKFRPSTDIELEIKLKKIKSFILNGDKTKTSVRFREKYNSNLGLELLNRLREELLTFTG